jgi:hypothetical protein
MILCALTLQDEPGGEPHGMDRWFGRIPCVGEVVDMTDWESLKTGADLRLYEVVQITHNQPDLSTIATVSAILRTPEELLARKASREPPPDWEEDPPQKAPRPFTRRRYRGR